MAGSVLSVRRHNQCARRREDIEKCVHDCLSAAGDETYTPSRCVEQYDVASEHAENP